MGFNNQPARDEEEAYPVSTWYVNPEDWDSVRHGRAMELENMAPMGLASISDGYVVSINYACEVLARQRGWTP